MNNEDKIMSMLETLVTTVSRLEQGQATLAADVADIKQDIQQTNQRLERLETKVDRNHNHFLDYEAQNAKRHLELKEAINKNKVDVDYLKAIK